jgi:hypothetical protein
MDHPVLMILGVGVLFVLIPVSREGPNFAVPQG